MKNGEEGAGSAGASPGPAAQEMELRDRATAAAFFVVLNPRDPKVMEEAQILAQYVGIALRLLPAERSEAPNPSSGEGPSPTHPHPSEWRP